MCAGPESVASRFAHKRRKQRKNVNSNTNTKTIRSRSGQITNETIQYFRTTETATQYHANCYFQFLTLYCSIVDTYLIHAC